LKTLIQEQISVIISRCNILRQTIGTYSNVANDIYNVCLRRVETADWKIIDPNTNDQLLAELSELSSVIQVASSKWQGKFFILSSSYRKNSEILQTKQYSYSPLSW